MIFLALRHLTARKKQTLLTLLGIMFGGASYIIIAGFFLGFQTFLLNQLVNNDAHLRITAREDFLGEHSLDNAFFENAAAHVFWKSPPSGRKDNARINNPTGWFHRLDADPRVSAYSPQLSANVIVTRAKTSVSGRLIGSRPNLQTQVTNIEEYMVRGKFKDIQVGGNRVILGSGLLDKLGAHFGETVQMSVGVGLPTPFKVIGIFRTGMKQLDDSTSFAELSDVQRVNQTPQQVNDIAVRLHDFNQARSMADALNGVTVEKVQSWDQINENFLNVFKIQDATRYMMIAVILIVAGFGIFNILNMTVNQKKKEIAILRSMGFESGDIIELFLLQGGILGVAGGAVGVVVGYFICTQLQKVKFGGGPMGGSGYLTIAFLPDIYVFGFFLPIVVSILASVLPARSAAKMTPIEIIRESAE